jgi:2-iminobutanoate/2-iminopropanoate deaminase
MSLAKEARGLGMPWEQDYGYAQGVKVGDTIFLAGQVSHDDAGRIVAPGDMQAQMRQAYENVRKLLAQYGATMADVVDEVLFVTDMDAAFAAGSTLRRAIYGGVPVTASTMVQVERLAFPEFMIEIKCVAKCPGGRPGGGP